MKCPHCSHEGKSLVLESRPLDDNTYRRRACKGCGRVFITVESAPAGLKMPAAASNSYARRGEPRPGARGLTALGDEDTGKHLQGIWG